MNFSKLFIERPVMTTLLMFGVIMFGVFAYFNLPVNQLPSVDFPTILVSAQLPGASADTMAATVATPLERQFSNIAGLESMNSESALGTTQISLQFDVNRSVDGAAEDVQAAISAARALLPTSMPTPPVFHKVNPADMPILFISVNSPTLPLYQVDEYAETWIAQRISMVTGVAQVSVFGSQIYAVRVQLDPRKLSACGLSLMQVMQTIQNSNVNNPCGTLYGDYKSFNIVANGQLFNAKAYEPLIIAYRNGYPVRIKDVGRVIDSVQTDKIASWYNNNRCIVLAIFRQPGTNTIEIIDNIKKVMPQLRNMLPNSVQAYFLYDRSVSIRKAVDDVKLTLLITVFLVVLIIFLFLADVSSTVIPSLALPVSIIGTFGTIYCLGFSLNNLSLMALTLCVGFVVDDAIVVLENIVRHKELGENSLEAALKGSREVEFTIVSMTTSLACVFIPVLFMGGIVGRLFNEFAVTITVAIIISGFVALTLTPMLSSRFLSSRESRNNTWFVRLSDNTFHFFRNLYAYFLDLALSHKRIILLVFVLMVIATVRLFMIIPKGFMPSEDTGSIFGTTEAAQGISFDSMVKHQQEIAKLISQDPAVEGFISAVGAGGPNEAANSGRVFITLKPLAQRKLSADKIIERLRPKFSKVPGIRLFLQVSPSIRIGGKLTKGLYQYTLTSGDTKNLYKVANIMEKKLKQVSVLSDVTTDLQVTNPEVQVKIDRDKCYKLGLSIAQVEGALNSAYSSRQVSTIYTPANEFWVIMEVEPQFYESPDSLHMIHIMTPAGGLVPLDTVAKIDIGVGPLQISHLGQFPAVTISFNLKPGIALSEAVNEIDAIASDTLTDDVSGVFQGQAQVFQKSAGNLGILLLIAVLIIYIVLGILYESYIHPITILSGLPSAGLGAILTLMLFKMPLDIYGFLGLILLIGIVKKNAIMMIDFAVESQRRNQLTCEQAIKEACIVRFRPIMMTTMCALMGSLPIAIGFGSGSEARQPLGLAVVGGLIVSQLVTLFITPVFYIYLDRIQQYFSVNKLNFFTRMFSKGSI